MGKGWEVTFQVQLKNLSCKSQEAEYQSKQGQGTEGGWVPYSMPYAMGIFID